MARKARTPIKRPARPAVGDKVAAPHAADYLESRATRVRRALANVPDTTPEPNDRMG